MQVMQVKNTTPGPIAERKHNFIPPYTKLCMTLSQTARK